VDARFIGSGQSVADGLSASTRYLESGNFIKLSNATLSYSFGDLAGSLIKNARLFVTGTNLLVFTHYSGFDPEVNTDKQVNGVSSLGIEYTPYPSSRSFLVGLNFSL
jgi:iron complex outermembrane receptor protein